MQSFKVKSSLSFLPFVCVCDGAPVEVRQQPLGIGSFCRFWGSNFVRLGGKYLYTLNHLDSSKIKFSVCGGQQRPVELLELQ